MSIKHWENHSKEGIITVTALFIHINLPANTAQRHLFPSISPVTFCSRAPEVKSLAGFLFSPLSKFVFLSQGTEVLPYGGQLGGGHKAVLHSRKHCRPHRGKTKDLGQCITRHLFAMAHC